MKVAILMPASFDLALIRQVRALAKVLLGSVPLTGGSVSVVVGLPQCDERIWREKEQWLREGVPGLIVRHLLWEKIPSANALRMFTAFNRTFELSGIHEVIVPRDWGTNFTDCDVWISFANPGMGALYALRPTAHYCSDLLQRHRPESVAHDIRAPYWKSQTDTFRLWRQNGIVIASDEATVADVISYAGVAPDSIQIVPTLLDDDFEEKPTAFGPKDVSLLWRVEPDPSHDIVNAAEGMRYYLEEGGKLIPTICTEVDPRAFGKGSDLPLIVNLPHAVREMLADLRAEQITSDAHLMRLMARSRAMWSSRVTGGEGVAFFESAHGRLPLVAYHTPAHEHAASASGAAVCYYYGCEPTRIADALHQLEANLTTLLPVPTARTPQSIKSLKYGFVLDRLLEKIHV